MSAIFDEDFQHIDPSTGQLLVGGKIYIGEPGLDPKTNAKDVFSDRELTAPALGQPIIIGSDGRASSKMWVSGKYSITIDSSADVQKYAELQAGIDEQVGNTLLINSLGVNDVTVTGSPTVTALVDNQTYIFSAPADNTGAMTLKIDTLAAKDIRKAHDQAMASGDVKADQRLVVVYNSTDDWFEIQSNVLGSTFGGDVTVTGDISAANLLNVTVVDIGDWNIDSTTTVNVNHGLTLSKIRAVNVTIRNDANTAHYDFAGCASDGSRITISSTQVSIIRTISGDFFDDPDFDSTSYNRGWIVIQYID